MKGRIASAITTPHIARMTAIILHEDPVSGNCYKIRLTAAHLGIPIERRG